VRARNWIAAVVATICAASPAFAKVGRDAFVIAGQSNAVGWSTQNEDSFVDRVTSPNPQGLASMSFRLADHAWVLANEFPCADSQCTGTACAAGSPNRTTALHPQPVDVGAGTCVCHCGVHTPADWQDTPRGSPWPVFADLWMQRERREVRFVATAVGGQCLVAAPQASQPAWDPDAMDCATLPPVGPGEVPPATTAPGELYCRMLEAVELSGVRPVLRAVLWMQGECDAQNGVAHDAYRAALEHLADAIWRDLGVPMVVAPISTNEYPNDLCTPGAHSVAIHDATIDAAAFHPHIVLGPDADDLALEPGCAHIHDVATLGRRWYDAVVAPPAPCENGRDDDGDGLADYPEDPGCATPIAVAEDPACQNGLDDDGDGRIDFDGGASLHGGMPLAPPDPQCTTAYGATEKARSGCGLGAELAIACALLVGARRRSLRS